MKTIDEQLEDALARVKQSEADTQAGSTLLSEAAKQSYDLKLQITALNTDKENLTLATSELTEQRDQLASDLATTKQSLTSATNAAEELAKAKEQIAALTGEVETLKANAKTAERIAAERYGAVSTQPLPVTSRGDAKAAELVAKFKAITEPATQTALPAPRRCPSGKGSALWLSRSARLWRGLSAEQRALILNAQ